MAVNIGSAWVATLSNRVEKLASSAHWIWLDGARPYITTRSSIKLKPFPINERNALLLKYGIQMIGILIWTEIEPLIHSWLI